MKKTFKYRSECSFSGNVGERFNILGRTINNLKGNKITQEDLSLLKKEAPAQRAPASLKMVVDQAEEEAITEALKLTRGDVADAAKILDIHRTKLYKKIEKYQICSNAQPLNSSAG